jgi:hypothetical protein
MPVSYLTLALFEDMGFYTSNYSNAEYWVWGKDQGCGFVEGRCEDTWINRPGYFCSDNTQRGCTANRQGKGTCNVKEYNEKLLSYYRHFSDPKKGGDIPPADFCPFTDVQSGSDEWCTDITKTPDNAIFEVFSSDSLCWEYGSSNNLACWKYSCDLTNFTAPILQVEYNGVPYDCPSEGGVISGIGPSNGGIHCPPTSLVCRIPALPPTGTLMTDSSTEQNIPTCSQNHGCFIATAAYGSYSEPRVLQLRQFRDNVLSKTALGREFIAWYYRVSPPLANWIAQHEMARTLVRMLLAPLTFLVQFF